jgi:natural product precursor
MKKQSANNKLAFGKATVTELNEQNMQSIKGGSSSCVCDAINNAINEFTNNITRPIVSL